MTRVAINGFGRIGRQAIRAGWGKKGLSFVAVNDLTDPKILAHLLKYDSVHGTWDHKVGHGKGYVSIDGTKIPVSAEMDPALLPWKEYKVDVVIESTGRFTSEEDASKHVESGARNVVISAPSKDAPTFLMGVNHNKCTKKNTVVNNASCTTNSVAPVAQVMSETLGVQKAMLTTIHSVTAQQNIVDGIPPRHKPDLRRARSAMVNIIPTTTGAAKATTKVVTSLKDKFDGLAIRVPTLDVSLSDFTFVVKKKTTVEEVNAIFKAAAKEKRWKNILAVNTVPLVSSDFIGNPYAATVDLEMTRVVDGDLVKVLAWYDNEWGYTMQLIALVSHIGKL